MQRADQRWWNKPLVNYQGKILPAELVVLSIELKPEEDGRWMNSRGTTSGVVDYIVKQSKTVRKILPDNVSAVLKKLYEASGLSKGCPDLVIWSTTSDKMRFVEVKCPHWDRPSAEQDKFMSSAQRHGIVTTIVEWEFTDHPLHQ